MSEPAPPDFARGPAGHPQAALTPEQIEAVLADFRAWLQQLPPAELVPPPPPADAEPIDLHTLLGQFTALRHEVNLQTRATRTQQEQGAEALQQLGQALKALRETEGRDEDEQVRPLLKTLVDLADSLGLARREAERVQEAVFAALDQLAAAPQPAPAPQPSWLARWLGGGAPEAVAQPSPPPAREAAERVRRLLDSLLTGYTMSLHRVERALQQHGLEPILVVGQPFDPEHMEVLEVAQDSGRPAGEVTDEIRRGYLWRGRVFRYAQVRVAK